MQNSPYLYPMQPAANLWPKENLKFAEAMTAFLNIAWAFIGQLTIPTFISEMKNPKEFPKVVYAVSVAEMTLTVLAGSLILVWTGAESIKSPAFPTHPLFKLICVWLGLPTIIFLGVLFSVSFQTSIHLLGRLTCLPQILNSKLVFFQIFAGSKHRDTKTKMSTISWGLIVGGTWALAFLIAEVIPFFTDMLSLMSSLFDSVLGFMFWSIAWFSMRRMDHGSQWLSYSTLGVQGCIELAVNVFLFAVGLIFLIPGTIVSCCPAKCRVSLTIGRRLSRALLPVKATLKWEVSLAARTILTETIDQGQSMIANKEVGAWSSPIWTFM